jgi:hypothetical protein
MLRIPLVKMVPFSGHQTLLIGTGLDCGWLMGLRNFLAKRGNAAFSAIGFPFLAGAAPDKQKSVSVS